MDAAKVLSECFPILEIVRTWVAAIKPDPGATESHKGMHCMDVAADRLLVGKMSPTVLHQAIIVPGGGASFHPFEVPMVGVQVHGDVPPLNKIDKIISIPHRDKKPG